MQPSTTADVVVIGGGGAGPAAALAAQDGGAHRVLLVEERAKLGGNAVFATGLWACETRQQREAIVDVSADEAFRTAMEWHHHERVDPRILRTVINKSGDTIAWLTEKTGIDFVISVEYKMSYGHAPTWHVPARIEEHHGHSLLKFSQVVRSLAETFEAAGGEIWTGAKAVALRTGEDGAVTGVVVERDGREEVVEAGAVVLATGGFHGNPELMEKYFYFYDDTIGGFRIPMAGDGIRMAAEAGVRLEPHATLIKETCSSSEKPNEYSLGPATRQPDTVWVNRLGRRFSDESVAIHLQTGSNPLLRQPGMTGFALYDDAMVRGVDDDGWLLPRAPLRPAHLRKHLESAAATGDWAVAAGTWAEVAAWIGAPAEALERTVADYNEHCARGYDAEFVKDRRYLRPLLEPPFHAIKFGPMMIDTVGPVRVDERMHAIGEDYTPVPGLYAAGSLASGWQGTDYCGQHLFGMALGFAVNSGRIAGEQAGRHVAEASRA
ncbi:FAD-dependent oxidoreductase [Streptomyces sp. NPDC002928]|uniref:FAD-dependent oxidoreductase n=1 Tax=Streptomyces sp. NPDC002928 TaxID=3154440 RepID=UPI0033A55871